MRLTNFTDYALRMMLLIEARQPQRVTLAECKARFGISHGHLIKIAERLVKNGFLNAQRGRGGGMTLARPADQITLGQIVRATETDFAQVECMRSGNECVLTAACRLPKPLSEAMEAYLKVLDGHTLADMAVPIAA